MKTLFLNIAIVCLVSFIAAQEQRKEPAGMNPFFVKYNTPFETPPFNLIKNKHFMPAFRKGMEKQKKEVDAIVANAEKPSFKNTVEALERSGLSLDMVGNVFYGLQGANTNDDIQKIANDVAPLLSKHRDDIYLNEKLFQRVKAVHEQREKLGLNPEQMKLLDDMFKNFVRGGANLSLEKKERFRKINEELSLLGLKFDENVLKETNNFKLVIEKKEDLEGLPQSVIDGASDAAKKAGSDGRWVFTVQKPSMIPFLQYAENRSLREKLLKAYIMRGDNNNEFDNKAVVSKMAMLRVERANLLGYKTHAEYVEEKNMSKTPAAVYELLNKLWEPALKNAMKERDALQELVKKEGGAFKLEPWDWWYYAEKERKAKYDLDENELRPYFLLDNVIKGAFDVATRLYGLRFIQRNDISKYIDETTIFEVKRSDGSHLGILYTDYFPRPGKQAGAWCGGFRGQEWREGTIVTPLVYNVGNFSRPTGGKPALLSPEEVGTLFHEFGHALNALLQNQTYRSLGVPGDFVELPSQIMENWAFDPEVLHLYARHYKTGETIPQTLIDKISKSDKFNQGFATVEYLAACFLDMDWHSLTTPTLVDVDMFEKQSLDKIRLMPEIVVRYRSTYFKHIWSAGGGYDAGYYYYIWAAVLDADAFEAFKEKGLFDHATAKAFMEHVLVKGATDDAMKQYEKFRGKKPSIEPLLKKRGLL
ncbi:MAG: M3 family metallopeptidase [Ignavibacteriales bacterium]|nr:M3 family metallopeptidase [Ignavibacteriales bacterium]